MTLLHWLLKSPPDAFREGEFLFLSRLPGEARLLIFIAVVVLTWLLCRRVRERVSRRTYGLLLALRFALYAVFLFMLGLPSLRFVNPEEVKVFTAFLVDTSRSMGLDDVKVDGAKASRFAGARRLLLTTGEEPGLLAKLVGKAETIVYGFDAGARRAGELGEAKPKGEFTNVFKALREVEAELRALPLACVVLLTDGCRNRGGSLEEAAQLLKGRHVPLHVVGVGSPAPPRDYEVVRVVAPSRVRPETEVDLSVTARHTDLDEPFEILIKRGSQTVLTHTVQPTEDSDLTLARLAFTPSHEGTVTYTVQIPPVRGEAITANNTKTFSLDLIDDRLPVLYVEGSPRTEYRFLRRAMFRDRTFRVVGVLRLAKDRFYVQGASREDKYLTGGFPATAKQLFRFETVILGDIEASYFTPEQLELLEKFVSSRGGGLLMLGGVNSFGLGGYEGTPVGEALPVLISSTDPPYTDARYAPKLSPGGADHPVMRLSNDPQQNQNLWDTMPKLIGITPVEGVKPGATMLIEDKEKGRPVLAVQKYGAGRVAAFTSGGSWYWQVSMPAANEFHERFWKQLIRWLVMGAKENLTVETDSSTYSRKEPVVVRAVVLGEDLEPVNDASVTAVVTDPLGNTEDLPMDWILSADGVYQCRYVPEDEGDYKVKVRVAKSSLEPVETGFRVGEPMVEYSDPGLKRDALAEMAKLTGGKYFEFPKCDKLTDQVLDDVRAARNAYGTEETVTTPLWDMPLLFLLIVLLLTTEWVVRRSKGLA